MIEFKEGDRVIWHSGWGYEFGIFKGEGNQYSTYLVDIYTGVATGLVSLPKSQIVEYDEEILIHMRERYGWRNGM